MADDLTWEGLNSLQAIVKTGPVTTGAMILNELIDAAYEAFAQSQHEVPVRTGALKGSGSVVIDGNEVDIGYGGPSAGYALHVHEDLTAHHRPPTKAKFLEDPVNRVMAGMESRIQAKVEGAIVGILPSAPHQLQAQGMRDAVQEHATRTRERRGRGRGITPAIPRPMTPDQIHEALGIIDTGRKQRHVAKGPTGTRIPTWYRADGPHTDGR